MGVWKEGVEGSEKQSPKRRRGGHIRALLGNPKSQACQVPRVELCAKWELGRGLWELSLLGSCQICITVVPVSSSQVSGSWSAGKMSCLQRRVWTGGARRPSVCLFIAMYTSDRLLIVMALRSVHPQLPLLANLKPEPHTVSP